MISFQKKILIKRFCGAPQEWKIVKIKEVAEERVESNSDLDKYPLYSFTISNGVTEKTKRYERSHLLKDKDNNEFKVVHKNDLIFNPMNLRFGAISISRVDDPVSVSKYYEILRINESMIKPYFLEMVLQSYQMFDVYDRVAIGSLLEKRRVHLSEFKKLCIYLPSIEEQKEIAKVVSSWDKVINAMNELIETKKEYKKGLMQRLLAGEGRQKVLSSNQGVRKLKGLIRDVSVRNKDLGIVRVLSVTNSNGFVIQTDHFDKVIASKDLSNYKIVKKGQFGYNPSRVNVGSIARLENYDEGILSPMYVIFKTKEDELLPEYMSQFIMSHSFLGKVRCLTQGSVRDSLDFGSLEQIRLYAPSIEEQRKITRFLFAMDEEIKTLEDQRDALRIQKKGLMQRLLTGEVRVKV